MQAAGSGSGMDIQDANLNAAGPFMDAQIRAVGQAQGAVGQGGLRFPKPFSNQEYQDYTGFDLRQSFGGLTNLPFLKKNPPKGLTNEQKQEYFLARIQAQNDRFKDTTYSISPSDSAYLEGSLRAAMANLEQSLNGLGIRVMYDGKGYFAYAISSKGEATWSTNLTRLRKTLKFGLQDDGGPDIIGLDFASRATQMVGYNKAFQVVISWHKLLNATRGYSNKYRSRGDDLNFTMLQRRTQKNLQRRIYKMAIGDNYDKYVAKLTRGAAKYTENANIKINRMGALIGNARGAYNANPGIKQRIVERYGAQGY